MSIESISQAYISGREAGAAVKRGDAFLGAIPEAEKRGHLVGSPEYSCFVHGFLDGLDAKSVQVTSEGVIVEIEYPEGAAR